VYKISETNTSLILYFSFTILKKIEILSLVKVKNKNQIKKLLAFLKDQSGQQSTLFFFPDHDVFL